MKLVFGGLKGEYNMSKEHKSDPLRSAEETVNDEKIVNTVEERLANLKDITDEPEPAESDLESDNSTPEPDEKEEPAEEPESEPDSTPDEGKDSDDGSKNKEDSPEAPEIPEAYLRAAKGQGWSQEDVDSMVESDPDLAMRLLQNAYETSNKATRDFAAIGRAQAEATRQKTEEQARAKVPEIKDFMTLDEIKTVADGDAAIEAVLKSANKMITDQATELAKRSKSDLSVNDLEFARSDQDAAIARANAAANSSTLQQIDQFFGADSMKSYTEFYGVIGPGQDINDITPRQRGNRIDVLQIADQLKVGKASQSIFISNEEALESAHLLVTDSMREKIITDKVRSSLKKRSKGKTLRPSDSKKTGKGDVPARAKTHEEAVANAQMRLAKIFG